MSIPTGTSAASYTPVSALSAGTHTLYVQEQDLAGNWSAAGSFAIIIDTTPPSFPVVSGSSLTGSSKPTWTWASGGSGGNGTYRYRIDNSDLTAQPTTTLKTFTPASDLTDGTHTLYVQEQDDAGNWSASGQFATRIDLTPPATTAAPVGASYSTTQTVTLSCNDGTGSGCAGTWYALDSVPPTGLSPTIPYTAPLSITKNTTLVFRSVDALGNGEEIQSATYTFIPGYTKLSLELSDPTIVFNGSVTVFGKLQNLTSPSNNADPTGSLVTITIQDPDGIQTTQDVPILNKDGQYIQQLSGFNKKGAYIISARFKGVSLLSPSDSAALPLLVGASAGYAILVEGKLSGANSEGLDSHNKTANRIYQKLKSRGFVDDNIYYFNYDTSQPGVDATPSLTEIQFAVQSWAKSRMNGLPAPLYLIMVDHGSSNEFHIDSEIIAPADLAGWLTSLEAGLNTQARLEKRVVIIGSCFSGSFINKLSKGPTIDTASSQVVDAGRVIITSAAPNEVSYKGPLESDGIRSGEYFLEELFTQLERGQTLRQSFLAAATQTRSYTQKGGASTNSNAPYFDGAVQHPMLDDNGDGLGSNGLTDDPSQDGASVASLLLGAGLGHSTNSALNPAEIDQVTPTIFLSPAQTTAQLWATVTDNTQVDSAVWVEVRNMSQALTTTTGTEQVALATTKIPMVLNGSRWEVTVANLTENGSYDIFYFVRDKDTLKLAPMKRSVVFHGIASNPAPPAPDMTNAEPVNASHQSTSLYFGWGAVSDSAPPHPPITYNLYLSKTPGFNPDSDPLVYRLENLAVNHAVVGPEAKLVYKDQYGNYTTYYWRVRAIDRYGAFSDSAVMMFDTATPDNADVVIVLGSVYDSATLSPVRARVEIIGNIPYPRVAVADVDGSYRFSNLGTTGVFTIITMANGYADNIKQIAIVSQGKLTTFTQNVVLSTATVATHAVTISLPGSGSGSVTSAPQDAQGNISCQAGSGPFCSGTFNAGQQVVLTATKSFGSIFSGWSGDTCSALTPICSIASLDSDKSITAAFDTTPPCFIYCTSPTSASYKTSLQTAYDAASNNDVILLQASIPAGGLTAYSATPKAITLKGGYDADFSANPPSTSFTAIQGTVIIQNGSLQVEGVSVW
jgi:hypothetical protein